MAAFTIKIRFLTQHINALINTANDELRNLFLKLEKKEMDLY